MSSVGASSSAGSASGASAGASHAGSPNPSSAPRAGDSLSKQPTGAQTMSTANTDRDRMAADRPIDAVRNGPTAQQRLGGTTEDHPGRAARSPGAAPPAAAAPGAAPSASPPKAAPIGMSFNGAPAAANQAKAPSSADQSKTPDAPKAPTKRETAVPSFKVDLSPPTTQDMMRKLQAADAARLENMCRPPGKDRDLRFENGPTVAEKREQLERMKSWNNTIFSPMFGAKAVLDQKRAMEEIDQQLRALQSQ